MRESWKPKLVLVRHAEYDKTISLTDPPLSDSGREQARLLAQKIDEITQGSRTVVWSSTANRARETAQIYSDFTGNDVKLFERLHSSGGYLDYRDADWLIDKLQNLRNDCDVVVIFSHLEFVQKFPSQIWLEDNESDYAEGIILENNGDIRRISWKDE